MVLVVTICGLGGDDQLQFVLVSHSAQVRGKPNGVLLVAHLGRLPYDHKYGTIMFLFFREQKLTIKQQDDPEMCGCKVISLLGVNIQP